MRPVAFAPPPRAADLHPGRVSSWRPGIMEVLARPVSGMQSFILRELIDRPCSTAKLVELVYSGAREPLNAMCCVRVTLHELRKKLRPEWQIVCEPDPYATNSRGKQTRYVLRRV